MCPPDPKAAREDAAAEGDALAEGDGVEALRARGDVDGLLAFARAARSGSGPGGRDMQRCLDAYRAAAELGSPEAEFAVALFCLNGGVVPQDLKEGAARLRSAAEKGSLPARVYLGNLYELGIHYKADPEKADVWYRNAARAARVGAEPGSPGWAEALAELGCARYVLARVESGEVGEDDKRRLLARARAHGYGLRVRSELEDLERRTFADGLDAADEAAASSRGPQAQGVAAPPPATPGVATDEKRERANTAPATPGAKRRQEGPSNAALALGAFGYALLFAAAGVGAAFAATAGARELVARGDLLPVLGARAELVFPLVLLLVGVLPAWLVYRFGAVLKAGAAAAALGGVGWVAWGTGQGALHESRGVQAVAFALAGFLAGLLVVGFLGGTKRAAPGGRVKTR